MLSNFHASTARRQRGFTLIELAVVLTIIAVMVGGIAGTSSLVRSASLQGVGKELGDLQNAFDQYQEYYGSLPGDTPDADQRFRCGGCNGNGNGKIDAEEQSLVLQHLSMANLLKSGTQAANDYQNSGMSAAQMTAAQQRASSSTTGRVYATSSAGRGAVTAVEVRSPDRLVAVVRMDPDGAGGAGTGPLSPEDAQSIDRRIDDGSAYDGRIVVEPAAGAAASECKSGGTYNVGASKSRCNLAYVVLGKTFSSAQDKNTEYQWAVEPIPPTIPTGTWNPGVWGDCSQSCGGGVQTRTLSCTPAPGGPVPLLVNVRCMNIVNNVQVSNALCPSPMPPTTRNFVGCTATPPATQQTCNTATCPNGWSTGAWSSCQNAAGTTISNADWEIGNWGACSADCDSGTQTRKINCRARTGVHSRSVTCGSPPCDGPKPAANEECSVSTCGTAPTTSRTCNEHSCASGWKTTPWTDCQPAPAWSMSGWSACSNSCGGPSLQTRTVDFVPGGNRTRSVSCPAGAGKCTGATPSSSEACDYYGQGGQPTDVRICFGGNRWGDMYNSSTQIFRFMDQYSGYTGGWVGCLSE